MLITYTDIAEETQTVEVPLDNLDAGTAKFMEWFEQQSQTNISFSDNQQTNVITTTEASKDFSEFDFSNADVVDPYVNFNDMKNSLIIVPSWSAESTAHLYNYLQMSDDEFTADYINSIQPSTKIYPTLALFKSLYDLKSTYEAKYNLAKATLGVDNFNDVRYNILVVRVAKLDIPDNVAVETIQSVTF